MSLQARVDKCIADARAKGSIDERAADKARAAVLKVLARNPALDEGEVLARAAAELAAEAALKKRQAALSVLRATELQARIAAAKSPYDAVRGIFVRAPDGQAREAPGAAGASVEGRQRAVEAILHGKIADFLAAYRSKNLGLTRDGMGLRTFIRETFGEATGDAVAQAAARGFADAAEYARTRFNAAGGAIAKRSTWGRPQVWDAAAVKAAGRAQFTQDMNEAVAKGWLRLTDLDTGEPVAPARAAEIIDKAYDRISTDGLVDLVPGQAGRPSLANSRSDARAFDWTSSEAWFWANGKYGAGNEPHALFGLITNHLNGMARDIGLMEVLGPNPAHMARVLIDTARKAGISDTKANRLEAQLEVITGTANSPVNEAVAYTMSEARAFLTAVKLGSATLSAPTDFATLRLASAWNGVPAGRVMARYLSLLNPLNEADRVAALRGGIVAENWARAATAAHRNQAEIVGAGLMSRTADTVLRASGLSAHTQAGRQAFQIEFLATLGERIGRRLDQLEPPLRRGLASVGIDAAQWDLIRAAPLYADGNMRFIHAEAIARQGRAEAEAAGRLMELVTRETDFAIPQPGAYERAMMLGRTRGGTLAGEVWRGISQLKSFPVTMVTTHLMRGIEGYRGGDAGRYMVALGVSLTVMGALAMQLKAIAQGRDPRDMSDPKFWGAAFLQGGGAGIFGDFINAAVNRSGKSFVMTMLGPQAGLIDDIARLTGANISAAAEGKDTHFGAELARFVRMNTPGTSLWYARLALDRLLWDRLQEMTDPNYSRSWRELERRALKDSNQQFWWRPGHQAPQRGPDPGAVLGPG